MNPVPIGSAQVTVIAPHQQGINVACKVCGKILSDVKDKFTLGISITEEGREYRYLLGDTKPSTCCGEEKVVIKIFVTSAEADAGAEQVIEHINTHQSTKGLKLLSLLGISGEAKARLN